VAAAPAWRSDRISRIVSPAIDGIIFSLQRHGGISVYFHELIRFLAKQRVAACVMLEEPALQTLESPADPLSLFRRRARVLERYRSARTPDDATLFHSSYYRLPAARSLPSVVTVHDFIYERFRRGATRHVHTIQKNAAIRAAQAVICISESTRQDLLQWVGVRPNQQVHVVHNGVADSFHPIERAPPERPYVLYVGERAGYKNFSLVVQALAFLPELQLHCVGGGALRPEELGGIDDHLRSRIRHLGYVSDEALNAHYNGALCLAYPSRYEGFGIPVLEAMRAGCPVVSIECKAVLEIGTGALTVAEGEDARAMATAILRTAEPAHRADMVRNGLRISSEFSWDATHAKTLDIYRSLG
jgi:mannosyltransferase